MKKWKTVRNITLVILFIFIASILFLGLGFAIDDGVYPDHFTGLTRFKAFAASAYFIIIVSAIPLIINIIILIVSIVKIRKLK